MCDPYSQTQCQQTLGQWNASTCHCAYTPIGSGSPTCASCTPVLVDVNGDGFDLTSAEGGVYFDLDNNGVADRLSWTAAGAAVAREPFCSDSDLRCASLPVRFCSSSDSSYCLS